MVPELRFADSVILEAISHSVRGQYMEYGYTFIRIYIYFNIARYTTRYNEMTWLPAISR